MLIIFDLDDTLIDTSGSVTPYKMKQCLKRWKSEGLHICALDEAYQELLQLNEKCFHSKDALTKFLDLKGFDLSFLSFALEEMHKPLPVDFLIPTTPYAKEILQNLKKRGHFLALVTGGDPAFQIEKLEKAGFDKAIFSKIAIPKDSIKKPFYEELKWEFSLTVEQMVVCGDRIAMDLKPAFELGIPTIHMRWGRGKQLQSESWVHHTISNLSELQGIIKNL